MRVPGVGVVTENRQGDGSTVRMVRISPEAAATVRESLQQSSSQRQPASPEQQEAIAQLFANPDLPRTVAEVQQQQRVTMERQAAEAAARRQQGPFDWRTLGLVAAGAVVLGLVLRKKRRSGKEPAR